MSLIITFMFEPAKLQMNWASASGAKILRSAGAGAGAAAGGGVPMSTTGGCRHGQRRPRPVELAVEVRAHRPLGSSRDAALETQDSIDRLVPVAAAALGACAS
jgi:hypothetical protein